MKRSVYLIFSLAVLFAACKKDDPVVYTDTQVGISRVTHYPTFQMTGAGLIVIVKGSTFTEPGIKAFEGTAQLTIQTTGSVNTNATGIYVIQYSATNKDGFSSSVSRTVVVIPQHETPGVDLSGSYDYVGSSVYNATVKKIGEGTYSTDNVWSGGTIIPALFISVDGINVIVPSQQTPYGTLFGTGTYTSATKRLVYVLNLPDFGVSNSTRTWQKK